MKQQNLTAGLINSPKVATVIGELAKHASTDDISETKFKPAKALNLGNSNRLDNVAGLASERDEDK